MPHDPLTLALIGLVLALQILDKVMGMKKKNGHLTEDKLRIVLAEEMRMTRHEMRNAMQGLVSAVRDEISRLR